jgi:pimeloyl-ACP methyl ester carboxylesterase
VRARQPDAAGCIRRGDVEIAWERYGASEDCDREPPLLFFGGDTIVDSHMWKAQLPWFARRHRIVTFDPPGNGGSTRTTDPAAYEDGEFIADALAVLDAAGVERAVFVGVCSGAGLSLLTAADHPDRVLGVVAINPGMPGLAPRHPHRMPGGFDAVHDDDDGWNKENLHYWRRDWRGYAEFFFGEMLPEPHSTKQREDCVGWALGTTPDIMACDWDHPYVSPRADPESAVEICRRVRCPVLVINGDSDMCQPPERSRRVAELTGGDLVVMRGAGHLPHARDAVKVNLEIAAFLARLRRTRQTEL